MGVLTARSGAWHAERASATDWRSGAWSLEVRGTELADVAFDGCVVLRAVQAVVRDRDWSTVPASVVRTDAAAHRLALGIRWSGSGTELVGEVVVTADGDRLRIVLAVVSRVAFETNRTGLVVLQPPSIAGAPLEVTHSDGSTETAALPRAISPHQPVRDIAALSWATHGYAVEARFSGDVFEMEDQRNWTDASFKTYSRPLAFPFPYALAAGDLIEQSVSLRVAPSGAAPEPAAEPERVTLRPGGIFPEIVVGASTAPDPAPAFPTSGGAVLVELDLATEAWPAALARAAASALPLDVRLVLPDPGDDDAPLSAAAVEVLAQAAAGLQQHVVARVAAFTRVRHTTTAPVVAALRAALVVAGVRAPVVGGARSHFTELNREHATSASDVDGIVFSSTPLFHTDSTAQLVEAVAMQRLTALQAVRLAAGLPVHVGPVTLRPRFNDVATAPELAPSRGDLAEGYGAHVTGEADPRQDSVELAAWTIASAAALAVPGVASVAFFEEWGPRGIRSADGAPYPVLHAVAALAALSDGERLVGDSPDGLLWAIASRRGDATTVLVANLSPDERVVTVDADGRTAGGRVAGYGWAELTPTPTPLDARTTSSGSKTT